MQEIVAGYPAQIAGRCLIYGRYGIIVYVLRQSTYRPRTADETSSPTITDDMDAILGTPTTTTDSEQQHLVDVTSMSYMSDSSANTLQSTAAGVVLTASSSRSSTVDDRDSTADQSESTAADDQTANVVAHRTQPSTWNDAPLSTANGDPVMVLPSRRVGLLDQATLTTVNASPPPTTTSFTGLGTPQTDDTQHQRQHLFQQPSHRQQKSQQGVVVCENGVCRLRVAMSVRARTVATSQAPAVATVLPSTRDIRDAKSVRSLPPFINLPNYPSSSFGIFLYLNGCRFLLSVYIFSVSSVSYVR